jgi:hypothetical protein
LDVDVREHHISIAGLFEPVAIALSSMRSITVLEGSESHLLFSLQSGAAALAREKIHLDRAEVGIVIVDDPSGAAATELVETLLSVLDYKVVLLPRD